MSRDLRALLRELAGDVGEGYEISPIFARRVRRARARAAAVSALAIAVVVAGVTFGAVTVLGDSSSRGTPKPANTPTAPAPTVCQQGWRVSAGPTSSGTQPTQTSGPSGSLDPDTVDWALFAVGAAAWNDAWAVGVRFDASGGTTSDQVEYPLIEHWNGNAWTDVTVHGPGLETGYLFGIKVFSRNDAWAVGATGDVTKRRNGIVNVGAWMPLALHWDGVSWTVVPVPALTAARPDEEQSLIGVAGRSSNDSWALGEASVNDGVTVTTYVHPLLHWDGQRWSRVEGPANSPTAAISLYQGISVDRRTGFPWIIGGDAQGGGENSTLSGSLVRSWNGETWIDQPSPTGPLPLVAVSDTAGQQIFAIRGPRLQTTPGFFSGGFAVGSREPKPDSLLQWDGGQWSTLLSTNSTLYGMGVVTSRDVWVAGLKDGGPLLMQWDGKSWTTVAQAAPVAVPDGLFAVTVANDRTVLALGAAGGQKYGSDLALWSEC